MPKCPICGKEAAPRAKNVAFPFCSARCKQVDLGKWLNEEYRVPAEDAPGEDDLLQRDGGSAGTHGTKERS